MAQSKKITDNIPKNSPVMPFKHIVPQAKRKITIHILRHGKSSRQPHAIQRKKPAIVGCNKSCAQSKFKISGNHTFTQTNVGKSRNVFTD